MLRNIGLNAPASPGSLIDLYGIGKGMEITEDDKDGIQPQPGQPYFPGVL